MQKAVSTVAMALLLGGCAAQPSLLHVTEDWEQCSARVTREVENRGTADTGDRSAYIGANGAGLREDIRTACGYKPSPPGLLPEHWAILRQRCIAGPFSVAYASMSEAERSWFREYSEGSTVRLRAEAECRQIYAAVNQLPAHSSGGPNMPRSYRAYRSTLIGGHHLRPPKRPKPPKHPPPPR
ncbi:hypothetical protein [Allochromatium tepidum]|uniref:Lipoprotein n=1 Tax=Allochromatium tepidum TaxID=553982 RepID=A0ABM7QMQ8_9GAMM|nr:hypothetical protein [Allochromatium tepidum]BCU07175.1 hypothetical protein Atep_18520 [Allochromatium tepidum]